MAAARSLQVLPPAPDPDFPLTLHALSTPRSQSSQWAHEPPSILEATLHPSSAGGIADGQRARLESRLGSLDLLARPCEGEFILTVRHQRFSVVLASAYAALAPQPEQECICVAHFEGDAPLAARWASGLRHSLERRRGAPAAKAESTGACLH